MKQKIYSISSIIFLLLLALLVKQPSFAQNKSNVFPTTGSVGIGTTIPDKTAILEIKSQTQGFLPPRMTAQQRDAIFNPAKGLMVFVVDGTAPGYYFYTGLQWQLLSGAGTTYIGGSGITISGNTITNASPDKTVTLTGSGATTVTGSYPNFTIASTDNNTTYTGGTGIIVGPDHSITNSAPDKTVALTGSGSTTVTGTYPNFTISSTDNNTTYTGGTGIIVGPDHSITNSAPDKTVALTGNGGTTITGAYPNFTIASVVPNDYFGENGIVVTGSKITNTLPDIPVTVTGNGATTVTGTYPNFTISSTDNNTTYTGGTGIIVGPDHSITNSAPDKTVALTGSGSTTVTGTYPNFTISSTDNNTTYTGGTGIIVGPDHSITNTAPNIPVSLTGSGNTTVNGTYPNFTIFSTDNNIPYTGGNGIFVSDDNIITNTAPNVPISIVGTGGATVLGTYPNFVIHSASGDGANLSLSNLTGTSINTSLLPSESYTKHLGSPFNWWGEAFISTLHLDADLLGARSVSAYNDGGYGPINYGISGENPTGIGVFAKSTDYIALQANSDNFNAVQADGGNYGVFGIGNTSGVVGVGRNGYGIVGTTYNPDSYAGYFSSSIFCTGSFQSSDKNLKNNIKEFSNGLSIINKLRPTQYEFKHDGEYKLMNLPQGNHYGLIAQDVEKILPNLVKDSKFDPAMITPIKPGQNDSSAETAKDQIINFKALNYTELIPIIIRGMQELSKMNDDKDSKIDELIKQNSDIRKELDDLKLIVSKIQSTTAPVQSSASQLVELGSTAKLEQNIPNPFSNTTTINYYLPVNKGSAYINFYSSAGAVLKSVKLTAGGKGTINVKANELPSGTYQYALVVDGKIIDTKPMVITR